MPWKNTRDSFGIVARLFHWTSAAAFILAYVVVYYLLWLVDKEAPNRLPILNVHWALGLIVGFLVLPRLLWRLLDVTPDEVPGSPAEHLLARLAHWGLYALMIIMPLSGYLGTRLGTDFGLFYIPSFKDTALFAWIAETWQISWEQFEKPIDAVHHITGAWVAWVVVALHIAAALFHHWVRRDATLVRMLNGRGGR